MKSLCWKELRENLKWALLIMIFLGGAELYALYLAQYGSADTSFQYGITLCKRDFLTVTTFGCAAAGLLIGLLQIVPELRQDQWASLLHRPVSRSVIFRGKVVAGLILYTLATVPPFVVSVWLVATPGQFGIPFVPAMALPGVADICAGMLYYFAALAIALQRGKWVVLRAFPLLAAIHCAYFVTSNRYFYVSVEAVALMAIALCMAGWGMMLHQEKLEARPWLGKVAFLVVVFYGACGLGDLAASLLNVVAASPHSHYVRNELADNGVPVRLTYEDNIVVSVTDKDGKPMVDKKYQPAQIRAHLEYLNTFSYYIGDSHGWKPWSYPASYRDSRFYLDVLHSYRYPRFEQWFQVIGQRRFIGYSLGPNNVIGILDQGGFKAASATSQPMPSDVEWSGFAEDKLILHDQRKVSFVSFSQREIRDVPLPLEGPVFGVGETSGYTDSGGSVLAFGVALLKGMAVYDEHGNLLTTLPYHQDMERWGQLEMGLNGAKAGFYLMYKPSGWIDGKTRASMPSYLETTDTQGRLLKTYTIPPQPPDFIARGWVEFAVQRLQSPAFFFGGMAYQKVGAMFGSKRLAGDLAWRFAHDGKLTREISLYVMALSLALAGVTFCWAGRVHFSRSQTWFWTLFVLLFNVGGFIAFRLAADWPTLVACQDCRGLRSTREAACPHCGTGWPSSKPDGTEIFDGLSQAGQVGSVA